MNKIEIKSDCVKPIVETPFVKLFDLQYAEGKHYFDATRRSKQDLLAVKSDTDFQKALADAATCIVIVTSEKEEPRLLLMYEYRYPAGRFLLSPPAGLIDDEDKNKPDALIVTAKREIEEETGIHIADSDRVFTVNELVFSTPGLTDECNGLVCAVIHSDELRTLGQNHAVGTECFNGFELLTQAEAKQIILSGRDKFGNFYSLYTWAAIMYFISNLWQ